MSEQLNFSKSRWNGWNGNECVFKKEYHKAIEYYNRAIDLYPLEYRYFVNRSYCFDQLKQFDSALEDAQRALKLQADWGKCYYRKARALKGLKRLEESKLCFLKVIQLEGNNCREAQEELRTLRQLQTTSSIITQTIGSDSSLNTKTITDEIKSDLNSKEEETIKVKKSNRNSVKNSLPSKSNTNGSQNSTNDSNKVQITAGSESKNTNMIVSNCREKDILKELSDLLLNKKVLPFNPSLHFQNFNTNCVTSEQNYVIEDNKSLKSISNESKTCSESETKNNRKNSRKGMDEIVEIWDDSRNHWPSSSANRPQNIGPSKSFRKIELTNPWKFKGLYITNIIPSEETKQVLRNILSEFGKVTLISVIPDSDTALINFDNCESPRMAMSRLQGVHMPNICVDNQKLRIKFRPITDSKNYPSIHYISDVQFNKECYFWRTTGCSYPRTTTNSRGCKLKHIPVNKGVDLQPWMQQNNKIRYKRQNRNRFEVN